MVLIEKNNHGMEESERTAASPQHITATAIVQTSNRVDRPLRLKRRQ